MAALAVSWVGGFMALYLLSALVHLLFGKRKWSYTAITLATLIAYAIAAFFGGYVMADGGPKQFANTLTIFFMPFLAVLAINLFRVKHKLAKREQELAAELERQEDS